jgi:phosphatidylglycerophosphate synthase
MSRLSEADRARLLKPLDSAWTVLLVDPPAMRLLPHIASVRAITPLRVTALAQVLGVLAVGAFAVGWLAPGAVLFELRFFVDCLDGKLARLRGETSRFGALLDSNGDRVLVTAAFVALAGWSGAPWFGLAVTTSYLFGFAFRDLRDQVYAEARAPKPIEHVSLGGIAAAARRRRIYPTVTTIEVEHAVLFVAPLIAVAGVDLIRPALVMGSVYFFFQAVRFGVASLRGAAAADGAERRGLGRSQDG